MSERGSAAVESVFAVVFLIFMALAVTQVGLALYARNVISSSAHEAARAAIELGRDPQDAVAVAQRTVRSAAGGLVGDIAVEVTTRPAGESSLVVVQVAGRVRSLGPIPLPVPVKTQASSTMEAPPE